MTEGITAVHYATIYGGKAKSLGSKRLKVLQRISRREK